MLSICLCVGFVVALGFGSTRIWQEVQMRVCDGGVCFLTFVSLLFHVRTSPAADWGVCFLGPFQANC